MFEGSEAASSVSGRDASSSCRQSTSIEGRMQGYRYTGIQAYVDAGIKGCTRAEGIKPAAPAANAEA